MPNLGDVVEVIRLGKFKYEVYHITGSGKGTPVTEGDRLVFLKWVDGQRVPVFDLSTPEKFVTLPLVKFDDLTRPTLRK